MKWVASAVVIVLLCSVAVATARHLGGLLPKLLALKSRWTFVARSIDIVGVPDAQRTMILDYLHDNVTAEHAVGARELREKFPYLATVSVRRNWFNKSLHYRLSLRDVVGRALLRGRPAGFLSADGQLFPAASDLYTTSLPELELAGADSKHLEALAAFLPTIPSVESPLTPLRSLRFVSNSQGWELRFEDGTQALWGDLDWTNEKFARLREVLQDARGQFDGDFIADVRYFEDGKLLLRTSAVSVKTMTARAAGR